MRLAFFGSPEIAKEILESIHKEFPVSLVVTQPDKPVGRKQLLTPTPVKSFAMQHNITVIDELSKIRIIDKFQELQIELAIVVAYGEIIPKKLLDEPEFGFINVHYSLLPKYRGASPVQAAILNGETVTGVTIMKMDEELDHGEIILQKEVSIDINDTAESLLGKLTDAAIPLLLETINNVNKNNSLPRLTKQNHKEATYCGRISKQDAFIEFEKIKKVVANIPNTYDLTPETLHNNIRAYYPWPNVWTVLPDGKRCKIISSRIIHLTEHNSRHPEQSEGSGLKRDSSSVSRRTQNDELTITEIQLEGKQRTKDNHFIQHFFS